MITKHTPGPWTVVTSDEDIVIEPNIAVMVNLNDNLHENARLIAAAPELLEALHDVLVCLEQNEEDPDSAAVRIVRVAIAKAEGNT